MFISVSMILGILLCFWVAYVFIPEANRISEERRWWKEYKKSAPKGTPAGAKMDWDAAFKAVREAEEAEINERLNKYRE